MEDIPARHNGHSLHHGGAQPFFLLIAYGWQLAFSLAARAWPAPVIFRGMESRKDFGVSWRLSINAWGNLAIF